MILFQTTFTEAVMIHKNRAAYHEQEQQQHQQKQRGPLAAAWEAAELII